MVTNGTNEGHSSELAYMTLLVWLLLCPGMGPTLSLCCSLSYIYAYFAIEQIGHYLAVFVLPGGW
jgi:hypothetical protein